MTRDDLAKLRAALMRKIQRANGYGRSHRRGEEKPERRKRTVDPTHEARQKP